LIQRDTRFIFPTHRIAIPEIRNSDPALAAGAILTMLASTMMPEAGRLLGRQGLASPDYPTGTPPFWT
jgi:hypothetical protein